VDARLEPETEHALARGIERLADEFRGTFNRETINRFARESLTGFQGPSVQKYLPTFVYRFTRERLLALAKVEGLLSNDRCEVLFVCVHNSGRSQMAAALTRQLSAGQVEVHSAGSQPDEQINPAVVAVMGELGLDLSQEFPKPLSDEVVRAADVVITMGCGDVCPIYPYKTYRDWPIDEPAGQSIGTVREIRDEIRARVEGLLSELRVLSAR
jgi:arsenate reductase